MQYRRGKSYSIGVRTVHYLCIQHRFVLHSHTHATRPVGVGRPGGARGTVWGAAHTLSLSSPCVLTERNRSCEDAVAVCSNCYPCPACKCPGRRAFCEWWAIFLVPPSDGAVSSPFPLQTGYTAARTLTGTAQSHAGAGMFEVQKGAVFLCVWAEPKCFPLN